KLQVQLAAVCIGTIFRNLEGSTPGLGGGRRMLALEFAGAEIERAEAEGFQVAGDAVLPARGLLAFAGGWLVAEFGITECKHGKRYCKGDPGVLFHRSLIGFDVNAFRWI